MLLLITLVSLAAAAVLGVVTWSVLQAEHRRSAARVAALSSAIDGVIPADGPAGAAPSFATDRRSAMQGTPLLKVAFGFAAAVAVIVVIAMTSGRTGAPAAAPRDDRAPLELVSMRHARSGEQLTVTGLVRNPDAAPADRVIAVVLVFDRRGDFVASGRAPLEFRTLADGYESPIQVTIPNVVDVGRYRVSFRTEAGVVRHVDRRTVRAPRPAAST